jgi:S-DNA-T family DNA segregation ATPase FtsK/SpoIIIE
MYAASTALSQALAVNAGRVLRHLRAAPGLALVAIALIWLGWPWSALAVPVLMIALSTGELLWVRATTNPRRPLCLLLGHIGCRRVRGRWAEICESAGLARGSGSSLHLPQLRKVTATWPYVSARVRPLIGQTATDFVTASEAMRMAINASRLRIEAAGPRELDLAFTVGDPLAAVSPAGVPLTSDLEALTIGVREDGAPWRIAVGPHTLVAGCSGAGKGSVFWSTAFALAPHVPTGTVRLHGIDLKGGMEVLVGEGLFTSVATNAKDAVALLEHLVHLMQDRTVRYAGRVRSHTPTVDDPLEVVMIDELAALTAYASDRDLQRRADTAINLLCSQGRAPGFMVLACLQDPRKEVVPSRGLFTQTIGLRLKDRSETTMVLGEGAAESGALCHQIPRSLPGVAYVSSEELSHPIRVRAFYADDNAIRATAQDYAAPQRLEVPALREPVDRRRLRTLEASE